VAEGKEKVASRAGENLGAPWFGKERKKSARVEVRHGSRVKSGQHAQRKNSMRAQHCGMKQRAVPDRSLPQPDIPVASMSGKKKEKGGSVIPSIRQRIAGGPRLLTRITQGGSGCSSCVALVGSRQKKRFRHNQGGERGGGNNPDL